MDIIQAIKKAKEEQRAIRRKSWASDGLCIIPTNSEYLGLFVVSENGKKGTRYWNPNAEDLLSEEWELF